MGIITRIVDRIDPQPADLTVRRVGRFGRIEVTGLPAHLRGRPRRTPDALDLAICAAADRTGAKPQQRTVAAPQEVPT